MNRKAKAAGDGGRVEAAGSEPRRGRPLDLAAFDRLVEQHQDRVFNLLCRLVGDENTAAELTEQVFIGSYRRLQLDGAPVETPAMIYRLAVATVDDWRRNRDEAAKEDTAKSNGAFAEPEAEFATALSAGLRQLDPDARLAVVLRRLEGLTEAEIAEMTNWSAEDLRSHADRGWTALKHTLQPWLLDGSEVNDGRTAHKS
jgi:RNA polymerase sigma-70 factor (ECF subfamily)